MSIKSTHKKTAKCKIYEPYNSVIMWNCSPTCILTSCHHHEQLSPYRAAEAFPHVSAHLRQLWENILEPWETLPQQIPPTRTHQVRSFGELTVGLTRLKTPRHHRGTADNLIGLEGASEDSRRAVLHHHFWVGVHLDCQRRFSDCK